MILPLYSGADKATSGVTGPVMGPPVQERPKHTGKSPTYDYQSPLLEERLRETGLLNLEKRRLSEVLTEMYEYLKDGCKEGRVKHSSVMSSDVQKPEHRRLPLNMREHSCTVRVTEHWHGLLREIVKSSPRRSSKAA